MIKITKKLKVKIWGNGDIEVTYGIGSKKSGSWYINKLEKAFPITEEQKQLATKQHQLEIRKEAKASFIRIIK